MNWATIRLIPWIDTRAKFVADLPRGGSLLDLGSSDGETLGHFAELRPDLRFFAADIEGKPGLYPPGCQFHRVDLQRDSLPWADDSMDGVTCMHLVEHLQELNSLMREVARLLKPGGRAYFETPQTWTVDLNPPRGAGEVGFTFNFHDDATHVRPVSKDAIGQLARDCGLHVEKSGTSRNWLFAAAHPLFWFLPASRKKFTAHIHWLGWSACLIARKP